MTTIEEITPDSERLTADDRLRIRLGVCARMTAHGLPWSTHCDTMLTAAERKRGQIECTAHENDTCADHPKSLILRLARSARLADGCWVAVERLPDDRRIIRAALLSQPATGQDDNHAGPFWSLSYTPQQVLARGQRWLEVAPHGARNIGTLHGIGARNSRRAVNAWARQYARPLITGEWAVIEDAYYLRGGDVVNHIAMIVCRDVRDPEDTQVRSRVSTDPVTEAVEPTDEGLRVRCDAVDPAMFGWDGILAG